ncbi:MAG: MATE family efflux transporter [Hominenteromicrobium sp.]
MKNTEFFEKGSVWKAIFKMSLPTIAVMLVTIVYNMADLIFVGQTGDAAQVAAVSLASPYFMLQMTLGTLIGGGGCTAISTALGAKDTARVRACSGACAVLCAAGGVLLGGAMLFFPDAFLRLFGADDATCQFTKDYLLILAAGTPVVVFSNAFANLVRAEGAVREAVLFNGLGTAANIVLDPVLISGCGMGVRGAAAATVLGNVLSAAALLLYLRRGRTALTLNPKHAFRSKRVFPQVLGLGVPGSVGNLLMGMTNTVTNNIAIRYGAGVVAAMGVGGKAGMIVAMIVMAFCLGVQPMIAYNYGAGSTARTREIVRKTGLLVILAGTALTALCYALRMPIARLFLQDEALLAQSTHIMTIGLAGMPLLGLYYLGVNYLQSVGQAIRATVLSAFRQGLCFAPMLLLLHALGGMEGMFWASPVTDLVSAALAIVLLLRARRIPPPHGA